jgi:hypothetical protein
MKKYYFVIILSAFSLLPGSGPDAAVPDDTSALNAPLQIERNVSSAVQYAELPPDIPALLGAAETPSVSSSAAPEKVPTLTAYGKAFLPDIGGGTKRIFSMDIAPVALIGVGLTGIAFTLDHTVDDYMRNHQPMKSQANTGDKIGQGYYHVAIGFGLLGVGEIVDNKKLADTGVVTLEALLVTGIATEGLKYATQRKRPNGGDNMSFPSGHASMTAALAASVSEMYDWDLRLAVPLYAITTFVGASRIQSGEHHLSDVVAGMTLGTVVGMSFAKYNKEKNNSGTAGNLAIIPLLDGNYKGLVAQWKF